MPRRHFKGFDRRDTKMSRKYARMISPSGGNPNPHREFACPLCLFTAKTDKDFKQHWKEKHNQPKDIGAARRTARAYSTEMFGVFKLDSWRK